MKKLETGVFMPITNNGWIISKNSPQYMPTFELNKNIALLAEEIGMDNLFSMVKWKGFGGETEHWDYSLESFNLMAGLAAVTKNIGIIASVQPLVFNPVVAAKMISTVDEISGGRFGLNLVTGQYFDEYDQMGILPEDYGSYRYEYAEEWIDIVKKLWVEESLHYKGKFHHIKGATSKPRPIQQPFPPVVCAGMSETGLDFTIRNGQYSFVSGKDFDELKTFALKAKAKAKQYNRDVKVNTVVNVIQADTDKEANELVEHYRDGVDVEAWANVTGIYSKDKSGRASQMLVQQAKQSVFFGFLPLAGSPETIATTLKDLHVNGDLDGILFTFPDYIEGLNKFNEKVRPLLLESGINLSKNLEESKEVIR